MRFSKLLVVASLTLMLGGVGCGNKNNPTPPPAPQIPAPGTAGVPGVYGGSCGAPAGQPINANNAPFTGNLPGQGSGTGTITLYLGTNTPSYGSFQNQNVVGSAQMIMPDLQFYYSAAQTTFCVTSADVTSGGAVNQGTLSSAGWPKSLTMTLTGMAGLTNPYIVNGGLMPGGNATMPTPVTVEIGTVCPAYVQEDRLLGCIAVTVGTRGYSQPIIYQSTGGSLAGY